MTAFFPVPRVLRSADDSGRGGLVRPPPPALDGAGPAPLLLRPPDPVAAHEAGKRRVGNRRPFCRQFLPHPHPVPLALAVQILYRLQGGGEVLAARHLLSRGRP